MSSLFWTNLEQEKKSGEGRSEAMSAIGQQVICRAACLQEMIQRCCREEAKTARHGALHARVCCRQAMKAALGNFACMLLLGLLKGGRLIALMMQPHGEDDPDPHIGQCSYRHRMAFAFSSFALIILPGPRFTLRRLPGESMQVVAQGFDTAQAAMRFGVHAALKQHRRGTSQSLQTAGIVVTAAIIADFGQQSWGQVLACTWQARKDGVILMGQKKGGNLLVILSY